MQIYIKLSDQEALWVSQAQDVGRFVFAQFRGPQGGPRP